MKTLAGVVLLGLAVAAPVQAAVKDAQPNGFTLENSEWVPVAPQVAYAALVNDVGRWWPADHTWWGDASKLSISDKAGGCFCELNGAQQAWHMTVTFTDPGKLLRMTGGQPVWREGVTTDNGNWVLDLHNLSIVDPVGLERELNQIPGVVSVGLFARRPADVVIVGGEPPRVL